MRRACSWKPDPEGDSVARPVTVNGHTAAEKVGGVLAGDGGDTLKDEAFAKNGADVEKKSKRKMAVPDGGLSWAMAVVCFIINMLSSGYCRCLGLFFNAIMSTFRVPRGEASLPLSIYGGFFNLSGLISGALIQALGVRKSSSIGSALTIVGLSISIFANGTIFLAFSAGFLMGAGQGIILNSIIVCVSQYFEKRRGTALGLNMAGATVASLVFPNLYEFLIAEYGLRGTLLIIGGSLGNVLALSMLLNPPPWEKEAGERGPVGLETNESSRAPYDTPANGRVSVVCGGTEEDKDKLYLEIEPSRTASPQSRKATLVSISNRGTGTYRRGTIISVNDRESVIGNRRGTIITLGGDHARTSRRGTLVSDHPSVLSRRGTVTSIMGDGGDSILMAPDLNENRTRRGTMISVAGSLFMSNRIARGSTTVDAKCARRSTLVSVSNSCRLDCSSLRGDALRVDLPVVQEDVSSSQSVLKNALEVLRAPRFYFHALSFVSWSFFLDSYLTVMFDFAEDIGVPPSESVHALTLFSATDTMGRLLVPFLSDYGLISNCGLLTIAYFSLALLQQLAPYIHGKIAFWGLSAVLGLPAGYIVVGAPEILSTEIGTKNLPIAYGFMTTLTAIGGFARPPVIGFFRDNYGSYDGLFRLMGGMFTLSFLFTVGLWITGRSKFRERKATIVIPEAFIFVPEPMPTLQEEEADL
ncbi:monocarboxylate transporter 9-like isoform X1 [Dermacentor albipictus]|uniref:monocarboxylate transporter 9-like isoform X1 n=2 Tax=Dermacentor albipictus TaxID=60249 RepID=UPI0031FBD967